VDEETGSTAPQTAAGTGTQAKAQPWRSFWPLQSEDSARSFTKVSNASSENTAKYWYTLERGGLIADHEKKLSVIMEKTFNNRPWYADNKEHWVSLNPTDMARRLDRCSHCGQPSESCACGSTFEGG
jgi:hypothetical protein